MAARYSAVHGVVDAAIVKCNLSERNETMGPARWRWAGTAYWMPDEKRNAGRDQ